jgi:hypothetical protein
VAFKAIKIVHQDDPRAVIWEKAGDLSGFQLCNQTVLVATYVRPPDSTIEGTSILLPLEAVKDDPFQSKVGMVLKKGNMAFVNDGPSIQWNGFDPPEGAWVVFRASEGLRMQLGGSGGLDCRMVSDVHIRAMIDDPDRVF